MLMAVMVMCTALFLSAGIKKKDIIETVPNDTIEGVIYFAINNNAASCKVLPSQKQKSTFTQLNIRPRVTINSKNYIVKQIAAKGFEGCKTLKILTLPVTIDTVGHLAFKDCKNLEMVNILSNNITFLKSEVRFFGNIGPFYGCKKLERVNWPNDKVPSSAFQAFSDATTPYSKWLEKNARILNMTNAENNHSKAPENHEIVSFADFAKEKVAAVYDKWVKKKPYESVAQYKLRTADSECEARKRELFENARNEYINLYAPEMVQGTIADYDLDYKVFTIYIDGGKQVFAQVPQDDKSFFEDNFPGVAIKPVYNIVGNELAIVDCTFEIGDRTYKSPEIFDGVADDFSSIEFEARKLDIDDLLAEENAQKKRAASSQAGQKSSLQKTLATVDNAPTSGYDNRNTYALVIGNENYKYNDPVGFAVADAMTFARYCRNTLGVPSENILAVQDVTKGELRRTIREIQTLFEDGQEKNLIVYYSGHGIPDPNGIDSYILPVDADAAAGDLESCYSLQELYNQLGELPAKSVVVYLDACFTGASRSGSQLVASRAGVSFERAAVEPRGNTVVFAATSANETAQPYEDAGHGIFTYFLLDKLQQTKGDITLGALSEYLITKVKSQSISKGKKRQVPSMLVSPTFNGNWQSLPVNLMK